jgi:hypothetical protein
MTTPKAMIATPTVMMVMVCPIPQAAPTSAEPASERCRLTMVATATTWSASVACRMPRMKPSPSSDARPKADSIRPLPRGPRTDA